jgi:hypothetical protein
MPKETGLRAFRGGVVELSLDRGMSNVLEMLAASPEMEEVREVILLAHIRARRGFRAELYETVRGMVKRGDIAARLLPVTILPHFNHFSEFCDRMERKRADRAARVLYYPWIDAIHRLKNPDGTLRAASLSLAASLEGRLLGP